MVIISNTNFIKERFRLELRYALAVALNIESQPLLKLGVVTHQRTRQVIVYFYQEQLKEKLI
jgi:hypothetical protein